MPKKNIVCDSRGCNIRQIKGSDCPRWTKCKEWFAANKTEKKAVKPKNTSALRSLLKSGSELSNSSILDAIAADIGRRK